MNKRYGFTLVEIMIVVAIIGLLAAIAIPSFVKARKDSQTKACINNLRIMDAGKEQAAMEYKWADATPITSTEEANVLEYIKGNVIPVCPAGGTYTWQPMGTNPTCDQSADGHTLPTA